MYRKGGHSDKCKINKSVDSDGKPFCTTGTRYTLLVRKNSFADVRFAHPGRLAATCIGSTLLLIGIVAMLSEQGHHTHFV